jgi:plasmid maintenance system antidote protein VapI
MKTFTDGEILKALRERMNPPHGMTQTQVAAKMGFSVQYLQAVLGGGKPITESLGSSLGFVEQPRKWVRKTTAQKEG